MLLGVGNEVGHAVDAAAPQLLVLVEQTTHGAQPLEIGAHDLAASDALLGEQAGAFEDGDVLLNRREAHRVVAGQLDDALLGADRAADDVAPRVIGERAEHAVEVNEGGRRNDWHLYNLLRLPHAGEGWDGWAASPGGALLAAYLAGAYRDMVVPLDVEPFTEHTPTPPMAGASACPSR